MMIDLPLCEYRLDKSRRLMCGKWQYRYWCIEYKKYVNEDICKNCELFNRNDVLVPDKH